MNYICGRSKTVYSMFVGVFFFVNFVNDIPQNQHRHNNAWSPFEEGSVLATEWVNPCGTTEETSDTGLRHRDPKLLKSLRDALPNFIIRLQGEGMQAIDTSDIGDWFKYNSTYSFLHQINITSDAVNLQKRHLETQKYVGAFQHLAYKQKKHDTLNNDGNEVTIEINLLLVLAKNLLCEIETVIKNTRQRIKTIFTREQMDRFLTFRNNNSIFIYDGEVDELDNKFAKVRFHEYVHNLQRLLHRPGPRSGKPNLEFSSSQKTQTM